jgi:hypothetical protein
VIVRLTLPIRILSEANTREHWAPRAKRASGQRSLACLSLRRYARALRGRPRGRDGFGPLEPNERIAVTFTRIAPMRLDDDNLARGFKSVRDGVADALEIDDGDRRATWSYAQERGGVREYAIRIEVSNGSEEAA